MNEAKSQVASDPWSDEGDIDITELEKILDQPEKDNSRLRNEDQYAGFDGNVGDTWIYPNNLPCRSYQKSITQAALYRNTLVVLPTGLGKTFIAAVVMYNIYRWYPKGKVIFMAPTRPLVAQQIGACQKIMPFPVEDTVDITGKVRREKRIECWHTKRVFFATPHVVHSDMCAQSELDKPFPFKDVKLIVVDEAHKARGRYAYTEVVQLLWRNNRYFRVLALSATPGRTMEDVADVVRNLFISHLEVRWDSSIDVMTYIHQRSIKTIVVPLGEKIKGVREELVQIIDPYLRQLIDAEVLSGSHQHITRNFLLFEQKRFQERSLHERHPQQAAVSSNFFICISLFHSLELLERHGLRVFINSLEDDENGRSKFTITLNPALRDLITRLRNEVGPNPFDISAHVMTNGCLPEMPADLDFGHPKFQRARECLLEHFEKNAESRAIVFCEYRESVMLMYRLLLQHAPVLKPRCFVGQGGTSGPLRALSQKQQIQIMEDFRVGTSNILIATSIGEEGIDVGEVDLIVCFDINTSNPRRFIQRIGRTGRQRRGYVVMLVTEGKEQQLLKEVLANKDQTNKKILHSHIIQRAFYKESPRLVPTEYNPKCELTFIKPKEQELNCMANSSSSLKTKMPTLKQGKKSATSKCTKSKQKPVENKQNLRNFFKKKVVDNMDDEDLEILGLSSLSSPVITQRMVESSMEKVNGLFKGLNMDLLTHSNTQLLETQGTTTEKQNTENPNLMPRLNTKQIKRLNHLLKTSNDLVPRSQRGNNFLDKLKSTQFSRGGKLYLLKRRYKEVREMFEKLDILQALDEGNDMSIEEQEIRETCQQIMTLFTDREALVRFLEDAEYESQIHVEPANVKTDEFEMSTESFECALDKIFSDLDPQGISWDSFDYRQEELRKTNGYKRFMAKYNTEANAEESNINFNSVIFHGKPSDTMTQFEEITIMDSKYCSQWNAESEQSEKFNKLTTSEQADRTRLDQQFKISSSKSYNQSEQNFSQNESPNKSTLSRSSLVQALKSLETKLTNNDSIIEIDSSDDDVCLMAAMGNESLVKENNEYCDKINSRLSSYTSLSPSRNSLPTTTVFKDELHQYTADLLGPTKNIESSFMSRQQSTPIPNKSYNKKPQITDVSSQYALDVNLDDFIDPFPEELEFLTQNLCSLSGSSSSKENTKPDAKKNLITSTSASYTSDLFRLLEAKPTNSVLTPKTKSKILKSNTTLPSPNETNSSVYNAQLTKTAATEYLDSPIAQKAHKNVNLKRKTLESETESEATPSSVLHRNSDSDFEEIAATQQTINANKITSKIFKRNTSLTPLNQTSSSVYNSPKLASPVAPLDSPKRFPNTLLATEKNKTSPSILRIFTNSLQRQKTQKNISPFNTSKQSRKPADSTCNLAAITEYFDSPITRKTPNNVNSKRKILESETESETTPSSILHRNSDSDFEEIAATQQQKRPCLSQRREKRLRRARLCPFFDQEAEKSDGPGHTSNEDDGENSESTLANFVCDSVIVEDDEDHESRSGDDDRPTETQMQAVYLQSVKSPYQRRGTFKIPAQREFGIHQNIYSQPIPIEQSQYEIDSFIDEDGDATKVQTTLCPLERAEKILRKRKRQAKRRRFAEVGIVNPGKKRFRKCYQLQDDSDTSDGGG